MKFFLSLLLLLSTTGSALAQPDPRMFPDTGFSIADDAIWTFFTQHGGTSTFGEPISREFTLLNQSVQLFRTAALLVQPDGSVHAVQLTDTGLMPYTHLNGLTVPGADPAVAFVAPTPDQPNYAARLQVFLQSSIPDVWDGQSVQFWSTYSAAGGADVWGLPTSAPAADPNNPHFVYQRFQNGILLYDSTAGTTQALPMGEYLKAILTGQNLPADLATEAASSPLLRAAGLTSADMTGAFVPDASLNHKENTVQSHLPTSRLGTTDMLITRVGFGAWAIGGAGWTFAWGGQDEGESIAAIQHAVAAGVNWIDTAAVYGLGHSEEVVARALRDIPAAERPYVFTKGGMVWDDANPAAEPRRIGKPESLRREVEASLRRLEVERIDLYQMHWPAEDGTPLEEYWHTLLDLKAAGKVRAVGLSNHSAAQLESAEQLGHVDTLQPPFSAIHRDAARAELPWATTHRTGVIVYSPMQSGLLSGAFNSARAASLPVDDWRARDPNFSGSGLRRNLGLAAALRVPAARHDSTVAAVAVAWTLAWPGVTGAIVGARRPSQVDGWLEAATLQLDSADLDTIASAIERTGAGTGPARPPRGERMFTSSSPMERSGREAA